MSRAIVTAYIPPTNHRPARISVRSGASRRIVAWDHAADVDANHRAAALEHGRKLGWTDTTARVAAHVMVSATIPGGKGAVVHVFP